MRVNTIVRSLTLWLGVLLTGCSQSASDSNPPVSGQSGPGQGTAPVAGPPETVVQQSTPTDPAKPVSDEVASSAAAQPETPGGQPSPEVSSSMSRKDMLKLVGNGVVLVTALDALENKLGFGSGCIVGEGLILTNRHVVSSAVTATVQTKGEGDELLGTEMRVLGYRAVDARNDLILLTVQDLPSNLYRFTVPETTSLEQHDQVFSMGHPDGLKFSTSPGFDSALLKTSDMPEQLQALLSNPETEWIQTDAVISGGSSGGPLLNERGQLVGVNTLVIPESRIAFAVGTRHLRELLSQKHEPVLSLPLPDADVITTKIVADIKSAFDREFQQLITDAEQFQAASDAEGLQKLVRRNNPGPACLLQCCELADKYHGAPEAADAMTLAAAILKTSQTLPNTGGHYLDALLARATTDPTLLPMSPRLINALFRLPYSSELEMFLRGVLAGDQQDSVKAAAGVVLVNAMVTSTDPSLKAEMLELATDIRTRYGSERFQTASIEEILTPVLDAMKLSIGSVPPDITGTDIQGASFRLSDYRGKVVVLDFWADWCPHCRNMYAEERELVEKYSDKPFVLLGVNGDEPDRARKVIEAGTVTWRSWLDGANGPISKLYQIQAWPTILVLDRTGRIRFSGPRGAELVAAIDSLLDDANGIIPQDVLPDDASWKYVSLEASVLPVNWTQSAFDDSQWTSGAGSFAFSGGHEGGTDLVRQEAGSRPLTTLFRTTFQLEAANVPNSLLMNIQFRDGVTVFLNGTEIYRGNVRGKADEAITALRAAERYGKGIVQQIPSEALQPGSNCLAVQLVQHSRYSAAPLLSLSLGTLPNLEELLATPTTTGKLALCRVIAQAGTSIPGAAGILEKLQADEAETVRAGAALAAGMNGLPLTIPRLKEPATQQNLMAQMMFLNRHAWEIADSSDFTVQQYAEAVRMAGAAVALKSKLRPEMRAAVGGVENTLGAALYRSGRFEESVEMLNKSIKLAGENPSDVGYLALANSRLGRKEETQKYRAMFLELLKNEEWKHDRNAASVKADVEAIALE